MPRSTTRPAYMTIIERVFWTLRQFSGLNKQADDETLVVARLH